MELINGEKREWVRGRSVLPFARQSIDERRQEHDGRDEAEKSAVRVELLQSRTRIDITP